jgi:hypothetical protein
MAKIKVSFEWLSGCSGCELAIDGGVSPSPRRAKPAGSPLPPLGCRASLAARALRSLDGDAP